MEIIHRNNYVWYWYDDVPRYINSEDMANINHNMSVLNSLLTEKGYSIKALDAVDAQKNTWLSEIRGVLTDVEWNITQLNSTEIKSVYFGEPVTVIELASNKTDIKRWFDVLNDLFDILTGFAAKWGYLVCKDGYPVINNKRIVIRGEKIG